MDTHRLLILAGLPLVEGEVPSRISDLRADDRSRVDPAMKTFQDHMYKIKRALEAGDMKTAHGLVDGAIKAFGGGISEDEVKDLAENFGGMNASQALQELSVNRRKIAKLQARCEQLETIIQKARDGYGK